MDVIRRNDQLSAQLRDGRHRRRPVFGDQVLLTQISREALSEREGRRWTDIVSFTINMEQIGDVVERVLQDVEDKKIQKGRSFSEAGMAEISHLHERPAGQPCGWA